MTRGSERRLTGRHVLLGLLAFFGVVASVNAVFIYSALSTWSGLTTEHAYVEGLDFNRTLAAAEAQRALGWSTEIELGAGGVLSAGFLDRDDRPLDDLDVRAELIRPAVEGYDRSVVLDAVGGGRYRAPLELPLAGQWDLVLLAERRGSPPYRIEQRLWVEQ